MRTVYQENELEDAEFPAFDPERLRALEGKRLVRTQNMTIDPTADFLRTTLAEGPLRVPELEAKARAAGLLRERQRVTHAKLFKRAKKSLGVRSVRRGFGASGEWSWQLDRSLAKTNEAGGDHRIARSEAVDRRISLDWSDGVAALDDGPPPSGVPRHRWQLFLADCYAFLTAPANWAERAASLGWNALDLFGCHRTRPLDHLGSAGLLWAIEGDTLVDLQCDCAVIEDAQDRSRRVYRRRRLNATNVTLPWIDFRLGR
jgi:hypothetical protein